MSKRSLYGRRGVVSALGISLVVGTVGLEPSPAAARHHHHAHIRFHTRVARAPRHIRPGSYTPNFAAIVVDGNTGRTLYARNEDQPRHPASITKVMTLYLLFEQLEKGRLRLDSEIPVSAHAAAQAPTKLGLRAGSTISVENAIKAIVTRSANDMAVAVAEAVGGDEDSFAEMMTRKAHALGMTHTFYQNASGLPNDGQLTTARDLAVLGRSIQERFPRYYAFFSTHVFYFHGQAIANHNHLLDRVEGMDGIKTGYTRASGFNLLSSVKRNGHYIVSVVLGGASAGSRDRIMADLIEQHIDESATTRGAVAVAEPPAAPRRDVSALAPTRVEPEIRPEPRMPEPRLRGAGAVESAVAAPIPLAAAKPAIDERPRPAVVSGAPKADAEDRTAGVRFQRASLDGSVRQGPVAPTATPSALRWVVGPAPVKEKPAEAAKAEPLKTGRIETAKAEAAKGGSFRAEPARGAEIGRPAEARSGWMIQVGATDDIGKATELLARAKSQGSRMLGGAKPFTEKVQKGSETLYRARFAGLEADAAEAACRTLKRSGFACFTTRN